MNRIFDLMRHGEPVGGNKFRGRLDDPLSALGWAQMQQTLERLLVKHQSLSRPVPWTSIVSSPAHRCAEFAHYVAERYQLPIHVEEGLWECHFGEWEGQKISAVPQDKLALWVRDLSAYTPPGGETLETFMVRITETWQAILHNTTDQHPLVIAHGGVIRAILGHVLKMAPKNIGLIEIPYACATRLQFNTRHECVILQAHSDW